MISDTDKTPKVARFRHRLAAVLFALIALLYVASWPGVPLRTVVLEVTPPPIPETVTERAGILDVVVTRKEDGAPLAARVRAFAMIEGRAHAAGDVATDAGGRARLERLPAGEHWIVAEAPGRARGSRMVVVVAGARRLDLELGPEHFLEVEVKAEAGAALAGAEIEVRGGEPFPVGARTDEAGRARIGRLSEGPFTLVVRARGYEEVTRRHVPEGPRVVVTLGLQGALLVKVVEAGGEPVRGARVFVASPSLGPARVAEAGADGTVRIGGLSPGAYTLRATLGTRISPIEVGVPVGKGEERQVELKLGPGRMVAVRVVDAVTEEAVGQANVTLAEGGLSPFPVEGVTDRAGRVVLGPIVPGEASLSARADAYVAKSAVRVEAAGETRVALLRGGVLVGRIVDGRGYAVDGATIRIVGTDLEGMPIDEDPTRTAFRDAHFSASLAGPAPLVASGELGVMPGPVPPIPHGASATFAAGTVRAPAEAWVSGRDGTFRATPVTPGRIRALVTHPQYVEAMSEVVSVLPDKDTKVDIVLLRGGTLEGRVVDPRGRGVPNAHVTVLANRGSLERNVRTASDGTFAFAAVPDALTVLVSRDDDLGAAARAEIAVPDGGKRTLEITLPDPRPALPVRVTSGRGPVASAQVTALSVDGAEAVRVTAFTDARGEAELVGAKGLALRVEVRAPGRATKVVTTQAETTRLDVELATAESVTGEVRVGRRDSVENAEVVVTSETGTRRARTNRDGVFTVGDLSPGPARLRIRAKGRAPFDKEIVVQDRRGDRPTELPRIELAEEGVVEGTVVDPKGDPVPGARVGQGAVPTYLPVGALPPGLAVTDGKGHFRLPELAEGTLALEAFAPDVGRGRLSGVRVLAGRTTDGVRIALVKEGATSEPVATGGVAITLGETAPGPNGLDVVVFAVSEGSEAERAGLAVGDVVLEVGGQRVRSMAEARARLGGPVRDDVVVKVQRGDRPITLRISREQVRR